MSGGGAGFGRKGTVDGAALAARRAAFLAEERARALTSGGGGSGGGGVAPANPVFVREKSTGVAYLLWFFLGGVSAHRFYLGFPMSAAIQAGLTPIAYAMLFSGSLFGVIPMFAAGLWILADAFLIPGMVRQANDRIRRNAMPLVFA
jgi:TM2 domain-containing membrane protein YozV